ncbi:MAG: iron-containing alcohol dehydrogenase [Candidatus Lokiarchaeota archaeon]|nr:iron-containing alcohol dehydrogenase [Candidatus Lokiarchaeota archaeon]
MIKGFKFVSTPYIEFGAGTLRNLWNIIPKFGNRLLLVIGKNSLIKSGKLGEIIKNLEKKQLNYSYISISKEPTPEIIDNIVVEFKKSSLNLIVGIGGGSVIDGGKAISAMLTKEDSIRNYLEGVGTKLHDGRKIPYIAIPTTSGTGSETTKNAVISETGPNGFKKSLRHDNFIPNIAIIDPELMLSCPSSVTAACGMDAFTQLLESYVSSISSPITDALAFNGMTYMKDNILLACTNGASDINVRTYMAYGSLISGITLANAGLGIIHGLASSIGGFFEIPHGVVCGTLLYEATKMNIEKLKHNKSEGIKYLKKYAKVGSLFLDSTLEISNDKLETNLNSLLDKLKNWTNKLNINRLRNYSIKEKDLNRIIEKTSMKNNPIELGTENIRKILLSRL